MSELIEDLTDCGASQTIVLLDTPHGQQIISALKRHQGSNVILAYAASSNASTSEFSDYWTRARLRDRCVDDVFKVSSEKVEESAKLSVLGTACRGYRWSGR